MKEYFEKYICSSCKCTKANCFNLIVYNENRLTVYKCINHRKGKVAPYKEKFVDEYFEDRNSINDKEQKKFSKHNNKP